MTTSTTTMAASDEEGPGMCVYMCNDVSCRKTKKVECNQSLVELIFNKCNYNPLANTNLFCLKIHACNAPYPHFCLSSDSKNKPKCTFRLNNQLANFCPDCSKCYCHVVGGSFLAGKALWAPRGCLPNESADYCMLYNEWA